MQVAQQPTPIQWWLSPWKRYALFEGRASRSEFWWFTLGQFLVGLAFFLLSGIAGALIALYYLFLLAGLVPSIAVTARRLHDIGQSGWLQLIGLIPILGTIALIVLCAQPSQPHANQYGDAPLPPAP
ncbi:MAG: membrane protein [Tepidiforma sp.]|uniref:DUF805 domain-containing protein n=1 Tax=Tepidiforma TaxID=2682228 RepID=UPI001CE44360|nr:MULTISPECIES: DUF805 domain-containing protein [Tepidiforma]GIW16655.1 MAG: membrane protein [Tepidiforma sp.]